MSKRISMTQDMTAKHEVIVANNFNALFFGDPDEHRLSTRFDYQFCNPEPEQIEHQKQMRLQEDVDSGVVLLSEQLINNASKQSGSDLSIDEKHSDILKKVSYGTVG